MIQIYDGHTSPTVLPLSPRHLIALPCTAVSIQFPQISPSAKKLFSPTKKWILNKFNTVTSTYTSNALTSPTIISFECSPSVPPVVQCSVLSDDSRPQEIETQNPPSTPFTIYLFALLLKL